MKKRYIYSILLGIPGLGIALIIAFFCLAVVTGVLWLYVYGDDTWPTSHEIILLLLFIVVFLLVWAVLLLVGFRIGKRLEIQPGLDKRHVLASLTVTVIILLIVLFHHRHSGNIGAKPAGIICKDYCRGMGFSLSGLTPRDAGDRVCTCFSDKGQVTVQIPVTDIPMQ